MEFQCYTKTYEYELMDHKITNSKSLTFHKVTENDGCYNKTWFQVKQFGFNTPTKLCSGGFEWMQQIFKRLYKEM